MTAHARGWGCEIETLRAELATVRAEVASLRARLDFLVAAAKPPTAAEASATVSGALAGVVTNRRPYGRPVEETPPCAYDGCARPQGHAGDCDPEVR